MSEARETEPNVIWNTLEAEIDDNGTVGGIVQVSNWFYSISSSCVIHCIGHGHTIEEAICRMMEDFHQRR